MSTARHPLILGSLCVVSFVAFASLAHADYTPYYPRYGGSYSNYGSYGSYGSYGRGSSSSPILSLEMDKTKILNSDFRVAAREGRLSDMKRLLKEGADVNSQSETGETALMYAARECSVETVASLLEAHARINERDVSGRTALIYSVMDSCEPVVQILLKDPAVAVDAADEQKRTALDYSVEATETDVGGPPEEILVLLRKAQNRGAKHHHAIEARLEGDH